MGSFEEVFIPAVIEVWWNRHWPNFDIDLQYLPPASLDEPFVKQNHLQ